MTGLPALPWARATPESLVTVVEESSAAGTRAVFERFSPNVLRVRVIERGSGAETTLGSGFVVAPSGRVATNFHVVADVIHHPDRYRLSLTDAEGVDADADVIAIDVVHDLALLEADLPLPAGLALSDATLVKGDRLYSMGNPYDLGLTVTEGTFSGPVAHSRGTRIHFTGPINSGMSGGPALRGNGRVAGVNVATADNSVGFLVPVRDLQALVAHSARSGFAASDDWQGEIRAQLFAHQEKLVREILATPPVTVQLGPYRVPSAPAPHYDCGGDHYPAEEDLYEFTIHECSSVDTVYLDYDHDFALAELVSRQMQSDALFPTRFFNLYSAFLEQTHGEMAGDASTHTEFRCKTGFVGHLGLVQRTTFCARAHREHHGLYDVVFKTAALGRPRLGLETSLRLSAVSFDNARRLARRHLDSIRWSE